VFFPDSSQSVFAEFLAKSNKSRPEAAVNVRHLSTNEATNKDIGRGPQNTGRGKDVLPFGMPPPVSTNALACYGLGQIGHRAPSAFEDDPM
jgi:hypothetical protein